MSRSVLLPRVDRTALDEQRRRVHVRVLASRTVLVLALLGLVSSLLRGVWRELSLFDGLVPDAGSTSARPALITVSIVLLFTARGLRRGHRLSWILTLGLLVASGVLHLVRGLDVLAAAAVVVGTVWLATQGACFPVLPNRREVRRAVLLVVFAVVFVVVTTVGLVVWVLVRDPGTEDVERLGRILSPVEFVLELAFLLTLLWTLTSPRRPRRLNAADHVEERERARAIVQRYGTGTLDYFALRDDKDWFFVGHSVVAHSVRGGVALVSPDPVGPPEEREQTWAEFLDYIEDHGWSVAVIGAGQDWLGVYESAGLRVVYLGDEAIVDCTTFTTAGGSHKSLRQAVARVERAGYTTTFHDPSAIDPHLRAQVEAMSDESRRGETERGFSMTLSRLFDPADTGLLMSVTTTPAGRVDAFCQWVPAPSIGGWSLDVMRRRIDVDGLPNGIIDTNIVHTIAELKARGHTGLGLNFAVLREVLENEDGGGSRLDQLTRPVLQRLSQGTQMATLGQFNEKFDPAWVPRYTILDSVEYVATQAVVMAGAEGVTEIPVIGRFLGNVGQPA